MAGTPVKILVPGNHLMAGLLGQRDELLRQIEGAFPDVHIAVRGNEVTVDGSGTEAERVASLFHELIILLESGPGPRRRAAEAAPSTCCARTSAPPRS